MKRILSGAIVMMAVGLAAPNLARAADAPPATTAGEAAMPKLALGAAAPEIEAVTVEGKAVKLADFAGKVVVLQFGSISEPVFRARVAEVEKMAAKYGEKVAFVTVYQREAHAADGESAVEINTREGFAVAKPVNESERVKLASQAVERLKIKNQKVVVDAWSNASSLRYGDYPNMTFVIDGQGKLQAGYAWMDPAKVQGAVDALLAGKAVPAEFRGKTEASAPGAPDLSAVGKEMGGRGAGLSSVLDNLKLTAQQKAAVLPALTEYLAEARDFREKHGGGAAAPGGAAATKPAEESPEDFKKALDKLRAAAQKLRSAVKENLSEADAKQVMEVLDRGPAKRLFAE